MQQVANYTQFSEFPVANITDPPDFFGDKQRLTATVLYYTITISGVFANALVIATILKSKLHKNQSYILTLGLAMSDFVELIGLGMTLPVAVLTLHQLQSGADSTSTGAEAEATAQWWNQYSNACGAVFQFGWFTSLHMYVLIAANRFTSVILYTRYKSIFTVKRTKTMLLLAYLLALAETIPIAFRAYNLQFLSEILAFEYNLYAGSLYMMFYDVAQCAVTAATMLGAYTSIVIKVRRSARVRMKRGQQTRHKLRKLNSSCAGSAEACGTAHGEEERTLCPQLRPAPRPAPAPAAKTSHGMSSHRANELKMTVQFAIVFSFFFVMIMVTFTTLTLDMVFKVAISPENIIIMFFLVVLNAAINPFIYFAFNNTLRSKCLALLRCHGSRLNHHTITTATAFSVNSK